MPNYARKEVHRAYNQSNIQYILLKIDLFSAGGIENGEIYFINRSGDYKYTCDSF